MIPSDFEWLVALERQRDVLREAERERLIRSFKGRGPGRRRLSSVREWLGVHLVEWGWTLQGYETAPEYCCAQAGERQHARRTRQ